MEEKSNGKIVYMWGRWSAIFTAVITLVTFIFAMQAVPISGAFSQNGSAKYPFLDTLQQYPNDFIWMYFAIILSLGYLMFMTAIHYYAPQNRKVISNIGLYFALMSSLVLIVNYYVQATVIPSSLASERTQGLPLLIQYNSNGLFIALEEIGLLLMTLSFLFMSFIFIGKSKIEKVIRWTYIVSFIIVIFSYVILSCIFGLDIEDRFEVVIITVNWFVLILNGILTSLVFRNKIKELDIS